MKNSNWGDEYAIFYGITNPIEVQVPAGSVTYDTIYALYGSSPNITIQTF